MYMLSTSFRSSLGGLRTFLAGVTQAHVGAILRKKQQQRGSSLSGTRRAFAVAIVETDHQSERSESLSSSVVLRTNVPLKQPNNGNEELDALQYYCTVLTLNQAAKFNPLSLEVLHHLEQELQQADSAYPHCRCVVINAAPGKAFCAGHDMKEIHHHLSSFNDNGGEDGEQRIHQLFETCARVMESLQTIQPITIAAVDGMATAAGCQLVASCDLAVATASSYEEGRFPRF